MFNFNKGKVIARIEGGPLDGKYVFYGDSEPCFNEIFLKEGYFVPIPNVKENQVDRINVNGLTGSGKSTWCSNYIREAKELHPEKDVIIITPVADDHVYDEFDPVIINLEEHEVPMIEDLRNAFVVYDDVQTTSDDKKRKEINKLIKASVERGRHLNIDTIVCSHKLKAGKDSQYIINESNKTLIFPGKGNFKDQESFMKDYMGFDKDTIGDILTSDSHWVLVHKEVPMYVLTEYELWTPKSKYQR